MNMEITFRALALTDFEWVKPHLSIPAVSDMNGIVAEQAGHGVAACVLHNWTYNSVMAHIVILKPIVIKHGFITEVMEYVFNRCDRKIMLGSVPSDNLKALAFDTHVGFKEVARIKDGYRNGVDIVLIELRKEECRWLHEWRKEGLA